MKAILDEARNDAPWQKISLLGVKIDALSLDQLLSEVQTYILHKNRVIISNVNVHAMNIAFSTPWFRDFLNQSQLTFCDGVGLKLAAVLTRQNLRHRFTPPDFIDHICERANKFGWKIFFLGAKPGIAQRAADKLVDKFPGLQIKTQHGYFDKMSNSLENQWVVNQINDFHTEILVLGLGMPVQEKWILENLAHLDVRIAFPAGALFDYISGRLPRAPRWMTDNGFEWLGRLMIEPVRLWKRYILGNPLFFWRLLIHQILGVPLPE